MCCFPSPPPPLRLRTGPARNGSGTDAVAPRTEPNETTHLSMSPRISCCGAEAVALGRDGGPSRPRSACWRHCIRAGGGGGGKQHRPRSVCWRHGMPFRPEPQGTRVLTLAGHARPHSYRSSTAFSPEPQDTRVLTHTVAQLPFRPSRRTLNSQSRAPLGLTRVSFDIKKLGGVRH